MSPPGNAVLRAGLVRGVEFFALWIVLMGSGQPADLAVGAFAAACATVLSLRLLPPATGRVRLFSLLKLVPRFLAQSVLAGFDVAKRALDPKMPLRPGFVTYPVKFARGSARNSFATMTSLLPGTVPCADGENGLVYHCLDVGQPVVAELTAEEARLAPALAERYDE